METAISAIYDAALSDRHWQPALYMLAKEADALGAILLASDNVGLPYQLEAASYPIEGVRHYFDELGDYDRSVMNGAARRHPPLMVLRDIDVWGDGPELDMRADYQWLRQAIGARRRGLIRLSGNVGWTDLLGLQFGVEWSGRLPSADERLKRLLPHLSKVVSLNRSFALLQQRYRAAIAALDRFKIGACVMTPDGEAIVTNAEARRILDLGDGVRLQASNRLEFSRAADARALDEAVVKLSATACGFASDTEALLIIERKSGLRPFIMEVAPLRDSNAELERGFHGVLVYLIDPQNLSTISIDRMVPLFGFTLAEAEVCRLMMLGLSSGEIAERRSVAEGTIKTQFRAIYAKTGVHRRVDLIRLALTVDPPIA